MARKNTDRKVRETDKDFNETSKEGSIREMFATIKLMQEGYRVSIPTVDNRYDLIAEKYPEFIRVQVKNLKLEYKKVPDQPLSVNQWEIRAYSTNKGQKSTYDKHDIDVVFAINIDTQDFAILPVEKIPSSGKVKISEQSNRKKYLNSFITLGEI